MRVRENYKKAMVLFIMLLATFVLMGCTAPPKGEKKILEDFISESESLSFLDFHTLTIDKRQTNKEKKEDIVYATVSGTGKYAEHTYQCVFLYNYYEKGGWILDEMEMKSVAVSGIQRRTDEEIKEVFEENADNFYISGQYDMLMGEVLNVVEPQTEEEIILADNEEDTENTDESKFTDETTNKTYFHDKDGNYFYISYSCEIDFALSYSSTISYSASGTYYFCENYNIETGEWEYGGGSHVVENQSIDNLENIVFIEESSGYYKAGYLRQEDNTTFAWYGKWFDDNNQEVIFDWEEPYKVEGGFLKNYLITNVDLTTGFNILAREYVYRENEEPKYRDNSEYGYQMTIDWDTGEINFTNFTTIFSILNTNGEYPTGTPVEGDALAQRKTLF